ncbi:ANTAR domain-containing protein [Amycolatopsis sp. DSM 110486]|nr:ANTAR domain-containing protein [Amycolatopsis sp. DSM 110486]
MLRAKGTLDLLANSNDLGALLLAVSTLARPGPPLQRAGRGRSPGRPRARSPTRGVPAGRPILQRGTRAGPWPHHAARHRSFRRPRLHESRTLRTRIESRSTSSQQVPARAERSGRDGAGDGPHGESDLAERHRAAHTEVEQLRRTLSSRAPIEQAKGVLMAQRHCTAAEAFEILRMLSQDTNVKLRDVDRGAEAGCHR